MSWPSDAPAHWHAKRLKFVACVQTGIALGKKYNELTSEFPYLRVANVQDGFIDLADVKTIMVPEREAATAMLRKGDVLMNEGGDADKLGRGAIWEGTISPCLHQNHVFALRPHSVSSRWLSTWIGSAYAKAYFETRAKQSTNLASISSTNLLELPIALPPDDEQQAIIERTSRATAKVDALITAKQRFLDLLAEKRKTIIATAVTRGLDPKVQLRDSGVPWLGKIPAHWRLLKFSWCVFLAEGQVDPEDDEFSSWPLIAPNHIESGTGRLLALESATDQGAISGKYQCHAGDVIYSKIRPALRKATIAPRACLCSADMYPMRVDGSRLISEYLLHYLLTDAFSVWAVLESNRVAMPKINRESLIELRMPVPPLDEQRAIVKHIVHETAKLDAVRVATERTIALLKERRSALIAAAVTGQLDVGVAA